MRRLPPSVVAVIAALGLAGCRQLLGLDDTTVDTADAAGADAAAADAAGADAAIDAPSPCPEKADLELEGHRYYASTERQLWIVAAGECATMVPDHSYLAIPDTELENELIAELSHNEAWLGIYDADDSDTWTTVLDQTPVYFAWGPGEPDQGTSDCIQLQMSALWADYACGNGEHYFVCECAP